MLTNRTSKKHSRSEDNHNIDYIDVEKFIPSLNNTDDNILEKNANIFEKLEEKSDSLKVQVKNKGGSKLRSWIYNWGERKNHPTDPKKFIFECNQILDNGELCATKIETTGSTGNIISHLGRKHKIYEHSTPLTATSSLKQEKIDRYTISSDSSPQMTQDRQKYLETLLFEWLVLDFQPLYLLKSPSFRQFINALNKNFELPTDKEFRKRIFEASEFSKKQLKQYIHENSNSVSLTCDLWTSRSKQGFLGITCHFITPDFEMREITLAIQYMPYPHTGDAIQKTLEKVIYEWELQDKVFFCTTDNAANMKKCFNQITLLRRLSCTAHTIQLVVGKGLLIAEVLIARAKRLINFFTSPKQNERLLDAQIKNSEENPEEENDLHAVFYRAITDVETRWSSTFIAWERLIILKPYIDIVITSLDASKDRNAKDDAKRLKKINLTNNEWDAIRDLLEILGPFAELTERLEGTKYATMSYIYPGITKLKKLFHPAREFCNSDMNLETNDDAFEEHQFEEVDEDDEPGARRKIQINTPVNTSNLLDKIKANLYKALENYYEVIEKEALIAALLDPRKKKMKFATNDQKELAKTSLIEVYELAKININFQQESHGLKPKKRKVSKAHVYKKTLFSDDEFNDNQVEDNEVERYLVMAQAQNDQDPLKWWDVNKGQFPILAQLGRKYLSIQATSGASERVFSDAGLIMSAKRTSMKEDLFEALIFLKRNGDLIGGMFNNNT
ncbi:zinc finger BED domain-containing protein 1-like [Rhizophagus irregularis DAOM 181602=DAOM 197198]|nr:zinc finger BED domain-containing protein 1-like [Rhizophagus irregularis DAOM 181602=DAOM 197198]